ncbi:MAG: hypothetical protein Q9198_006521 [Flavoplaca austrocitrina]
MKLFFYTFGLLGVIGTWGRASLDGTLVHLFNALHGSQEYVLPGTSSLLRGRFTGIYWPVDYMLKVLVVVFWEAVDGSRPGTSAVGVYFLGQLFPILVAFYLDYCRRGQGFGSRLFVPTLWLLLFQAYAIGCTGFLWALAYTASSPTTSGSMTLNKLQSVSLASPQMILSILPALALGYLLPAILMALPSPKLVSNDFQQLAVVFWNVFPLLVLGFLQIFGTIIPMLTRQPKNRSASSPDNHLRCVRFVSLTSLMLSAALHVAIVAGSISTLLFPALFSPKYVTELGPASLFLPPVSIDRGDSVGAGFRSFFLWDQAAGYPVMIMVMVMQLRTANVSRGVSIGWAKAIGSAMLISLVAGPGSACLALSWWRDEILFGVERADGRKHK